MKTLASGIWTARTSPRSTRAKPSSFLAQVCQTNRAGKNSFVPGRFAMTCCVQDIQFVGFPCVLRRLQGPGAACLGRA